MKIKFCGAAREVTGSCHLITLDDGFTILLDCGLYQGRNEAMVDFNEKWLFEPAEIVIEGGVNATNAALLKDKLNASLDRKTTYVSILMQGSSWSRPPVAGPLRSVAAQTRPWSPSTIRSK